ncbi:Hsp20/alpha crystallin family protein [Acidipropionibacterium jensenii]|jgi:HSP20 family protein|uniref:Hsp20/alpha crystallin family protein n=1 Tax=Acidipropionibacterium jensenii TaxID=1749 RepID=UPI000BC2ED1A|nr:Hsp20/alpha crystallin family protein [Acidipropionibacterium jensenii]AZZ42931.1 Hsp20/alpha crystallin family protein [Acidipropionibacterium jensenii]
MALVEVNPFRGLDRFFDQFAQLATGDAKLMPMDVYRDADNYVAKMDLPGVDPASIDIDVNDNVLTVRAERTAQDVKHDEHSGWVSRERSYGSFARQLSLDSGLDASRISADYTNGELVITIPVADQAKPQKIQVTHGQQQVGTGSSKGSAVDSGTDSAKASTTDADKQRQHA